MPQLIKDGAIADDRWTLLREATSLADVPNGEPAIVPLALWLAPISEDLPAISPRQPPPREPPGK